MRNGVRFVNSCIPIGSKGGGDVRKLTIGFRRFLPQTLELDVECDCALQFTPQTRQITWCSIGCEPSPHSTSVPFFLLVVRAEVSKMTDFKVNQLQHSIALLVRIED